MAQVSVRQRLPGDVAWIFSIASAWSGIVYLHSVRFGLDSHAYWGAWRGEMYGSMPGTLDAYLYSPAFAQTIWPLAQLPWPSFGFVISAAAGLSLAWLLWPLGVKWGGPAWLLCLYEVLSGNIFWLLALVAAYGLRFPVLWALPAVTKITPALGPVWFAARREWRALGASLAATALIVGVSWMLAPALWHDWLSLLVSSSNRVAEPVGIVFAPPLTIRFPAAILLVIWGARGDRRWSLPVAMLLATPVFGMGAVALLAAMPRLLQGHSSDLDKATGPDLATGQRR